MPINPIQFGWGRSLREFFARYGTAEQCEAALEQARWPMGFFCPDSRGNERAHRLVMHHDRLSSVPEAWVWLTEIRMLARRLTA